MSKHFKERYSNKWQALKNEATPQMMRRNEDYVSI